MSMSFPYTVTVKLPSDLEVIPSIRKFVSEILQVSGFSAKFAFRSEVIVDAICNNAITYGSGGDGDSEIEVICEIHEDRMEVMVKDKGGTPEHLKRLKEAVQKSTPKARDIPAMMGEVPTGMGLEIVKLLSEKIEFHVDENNVTSVHVVRKREDAA